MDIIDGEIVGSRAARFLDYCAAIGQGEAVSRLDMAIRMSAHYQTARYNLDRAVAEGYLNKYYGMASESQPGWVYMHSEDMPK